MSVPGPADQFIEAIAERVALKVLEQMRYTPTTTERELLTVKQTAERIGRTPGAVRALIARGELP